MKQMEKTFAQQKRDAIKDKKVWCLVCEEFTYQIRGTAKDSCQCVLKEFLEGKPADQVELGDRSPRGSESVGMIASTE